MKTGWRVKEGLGNRSLTKPRVWTGTMGDRSICGGTRLSLVSMPIGELVKSAQEQTTAVTLVEYLDPTRVEPPRLLLLPGK